MAVSQISCFFVMMFKKGILLILLIIASNYGMGQVQTRFAGWLNSSNSFKLNKKFGWQIDGSIRSSDQWKYIQTLVLRNGINYQFNNNISALVAYAIFYYQINIGEVSGHTTDHQLWQQFFIRHRLFNRLNTTHRLTLEERFIANPVLENNSIKTNDHTFALLFRYLLRNVFPFRNENVLTRGPYAYAQQEILLFVGDKTASNGNTFNQFRALTGLGYRFSPKWDMESGYLFRILSTRTGAHFHDNIIHVTSFIRL